METDAFAAVPGEGVDEKFRAASISLTTPPWRRGKTFLLRARDAALHGEVPGLAGLGWGRRRELRGLEIRAAPSSALPSRDRSTPSTPVLAEHQNVRVIFSSYPVTGSVAIALMRSPPTLLPTRCVHFFSPYCDAVVFRLLWCCVLLGLQALQISRRAGRSSAPRKRPILLQPSSRLAQRFGSATCRAGFTAPSQSRGR